MNARAVEHQSVEENLRHAIERNELVLHTSQNSTSLLGKSSAPRRWSAGVTQSEGCFLPRNLSSLRRTAPHRTDRSLDTPGSLQTSARLAGSRAAGAADVDERLFGGATWPGLRRRPALDLDGNGLEPHLLEIELTETMLIDDSLSIADVLRELKEIGVLLALDDFGTGYSSLTNLRRFPIDALKIDLSFIRELATDNDGSGIVTAMIGMGRNLHMQVVAEAWKHDDSLKYCGSTAVIRLKGIISVGLCRVRNSAGCWNAVSSSWRTPDERVAFSPPQTSQDSATERRGRGRCFDALRTGYVTAVPMIKPRFSTRCRYMLPCSTLKARSYR